jgi:hypothetical protein
MAAGPLENPLPHPACLLQGCLPRLVVLMQTRPWNSDRRADRLCKQVWPPPAILTAARRLPMPRGAARAWPPVLLGQPLSLVHLSADSATLRVGRNWGTGLWQAKVIGVCLLGVISDGVCVAAPPLQLKAH